MIHFMEYWKDGTAHGKLDGLLGGMLLGKEYGTLLRSAVIVFNGELYL